LPLQYRVFGCTLNPRSSKPVISNCDARRLFLHRHALGERSGHPLKDGEVLSVVRRLGFVRFDSSTRGNGPNPNPTVRILSSAR